MYLFHFEGQIYMQHMIATPPRWKRVLWFLGVIKSPYDKEFIEQMTDQIISWATASLDELNKLASKKVVPINQ